MKEGTFVDEKRLTIETVLSMRNITIHIVGRKNETS